MRPLPRQSHLTRLSAADRVNLYQELTPVVALELGRQALRRQALRRLGILEIRSRLKEMFPLYSRREIRQLAFALHKKAWDGRDKEAVGKVMHGGGGKVEGA